MPAPKAAGAAKRREVFVACSRARDRLLVTWAGPPARFVAEARPDDLGADVDGADADGWTALVWAADNDDGDACGMGVVTSGVWQLTLRSAAASGGATVHGGPDQQKRLSDLASRAAQGQAQTGPGPARLEAPPLQSAPRLTLGPSPPGRPQPRQPCPVPPP